MSGLFLKEPGGAISDNGPGSPVLTMVLFLA